VWIWGHPPVGYLPLEGERWLVVGGLMAADMASSWVFTRFDYYKKEVMRTRDQMMMLSPGELVWAIVALSFAEEFLFRGALLPHIGVWGQAALFTAMHTQYRDIRSFLTLFGVGVGMAWMTEYTRGICIPALFHIGHNLWLLYLTRNMVKEE
jgi:membrane protease YdiL (CAAX protease family)